MNPYEYQFDVESEGIASRVVRLVGRDKRVLELGCSSGHMSKVLVERGCEVIGVERDADAAFKARKICNQVYEADLDDSRWVEVFKEQPKFDVIVAADVLEHLRDPKSCLTNLRELLTDNGTLVVSTPNIAHGGVIASLMQGHFQYRDTGLLDRTHIHFFTETSLRDALQEKGFVVGHFDSVNAGPEHHEFAQYWNQLTPELRDAVSRIPNSQAFQFVLSATKPNESVNASSLYETQRQLEACKEQIIQLKDSLVLEQKKIVEQSLVLIAQKQAIEEKMQTIKEQAYTVENCSQLINALNQTIEDQSQVNLHKNTIIDEQKQVIDKQKKLIQELYQVQEEYGERDRIKLLDWSKKFLNQQEKIDLQEKQIEEQTALLDQKNAALLQLTLKLSDANQMLHVLVNSSSWRLTSPLRFVAKKIPAKPRHLIHSSLRITYQAIKKLVADPINVPDQQTHSNIAPVVTNTDTPQPHFCPPVDDHSIAIPLLYEMETWLTHPRIAIVCHMFYTDLVNEFANYFLNIPFEFDLYITTNTDEKSELINKYFTEWKKGKVEVRISPNRGRDIAPKLITCRDVYDKYEFVLHIHTKKSPHRGHENGWRNFLLDTMLGSTRIVESVFEAFRVNPRLGMIAPQHLEDVRPYIGWGWNFEIAKQFGERLGIPLSLSGEVDFPSGSMFWARSAALKSMLDVQLTFEDFPEELGQLDGTLGHVIERFYFLAVEKAGFEWTKIAIRSMHPAYAERVVDILSREKLQEFMKEHNCSLLETYANNPEQNLSKFGANNSIQLNKVEKSFYMRVFKTSEYRNSMDFSRFVEQIHLLKQGCKSEIDFDENFYREANPDVAHQIRLGAIPCAYAHYCLAGRAEKRLWSDNQLVSRFSQKPKLGQGFLAPANLRSLPTYGPDLSDLPISKDPFLLIFFSHLQDDLFFAGYSEFFKDFQPIFDNFSKVVLSVASEQFNPKLATRYSDKITVMHESKISKLKVRPNVIVSFNSELQLKARDIFGDLQHTIYYCQDFEAGFYPMGTTYARAEMAITNANNLILSSGLLKKFLEKSGLVNDEQKVFVTTPSIEIFPVAEVKKRRIFFYFRPEQFNARNLPELLMETVEQFCKKHTGYELFLLGTVNTSMSSTSNGNSIFIMSKLDKKEYIDLLSTCDAAVSMIYSAHPGVIAFQTAASGIPTVTNIFENRDANFLRKVSNNFIPFDPVRDSLLEKLEIALNMPKGVPSFEKDLYEERGNVSLSDFVNDVRLR